MSKRLKSQKGISLIEVMASMVIFAVGLLMLIPLILTSITANEFADDMSKATLYAQQKMEVLKNTSALNSGNDVIDGMNRTWAVEDVATSLKKITITVNWQDARSRSHQIQTITYEVR
jgi:prepilin-type N-terminal cleavage/methylation domain-containing protein